MKWPQIVMAVVMLLNFFINLILHGEQKGEYNFFTAVVDIAIEAFILHMGGFW